MFMSSSSLPSAFHSGVVAACGFQKKLVRATRQLLGMTCNFENSLRASHLNVEERTMNSTYFQKWFHDLKQDYGIELQNVVVFLSASIYLVGTTRKGNLLEYGVLKEDKATLRDLLRANNINQDKLQAFVNDIKKHLEIPESAKLMKGMGDKPDISLFGKQYT